MSQHQLHYYIDIQQQQYLRATYVLFLTFISKISWYVYDGLRLLIITVSYISITIKSFCARFDEIWCNIMLKNKNI